MKRIAAIILLICHVNVFMCISRVAANDLLAKSGKEVIDINSLLDYLQVCLGNDNGADDTNDEAQCFHITNTVDYCYEPQYVLIKHRKYTGSVTPRSFKEYTSKKPLSIALDILVPPPKA